ncbi:MAG: fibronectin type III domain-containing protein, partial [bacterium]
MGLLLALPLYAQSPPDAPSGLSASAVSTSQIDLTWTDNSGDEDGFKIERATSSGGPYSEIADVGADMTGYSDNTGLSANTQYFYEIRAYNANGNSSYSNEANATTHPNAPAAPGSLTATAMSSSQIDLAWTDNSDGDDQEDGFKIERKTGAGGTYAEIASVGADETTYSDNTGLSENTVYYYRVLAHNTTGNSAYSNEANATPPLAPPAGLTTTTTSNTSIDLAWTDNSSTEDGYKIELSTVGVSGPFTQIATASADAESYSSMGLNSDTPYYFRVRAFQGTSHSDYSNVSEATTFPDPPAAPNSLTATAASNTQINLTWADNASNEEGFKIERKLTAGVTFNQIATVGAGVTNYSDTGLSSTTSYTYRVRAHNDGGHSAYSSQVSVTTLPDPPPAPSGLTATTVSNSRIDLAWTDNATTETGFKIERKIGAGGTYTQIDTVGANVTSYASTGLTGSTAYYYRVRAYNVSGNSAYSDGANATTQQDAPAAPSGLAATAISNERIDLTWTDNSGNEDGFKIEIKAGASGTYTQITSVAANVTSYSSTGLEAATEYFFRVRGFNGTGNSAYSNEDSATTLPDPPAAPGSLSATAVSQNQINLTWTDNANNENGFKIESKLSAAATYNEIATVGANVTSYSNTGLSGSTEYMYRVRAHNAGGNSAYSNVATATTLPDAPAAPSNLTAITASNTQINLSWTDNSNYENGFTVELKTASDSFYVEIDSVGANVTGYQSMGLNPNTPYFYRVRAFNVTGNSAYSNVADATTNPEPPVAPSGLTATAVSNTQINLTWTDHASNEDGFKIERKLTSAAVFAEIATVGANATSYSSTGLTGSASYTYRVRAFNATGNSSYSNEASATTLVNPPNAPSSLAATTVSTSQINLTWTDNANDEDGFKIERRAAGDTMYAQIASVGAGVTNYSSTGLAANTQYFYRVRAFKSTSHSAYSNEADATTFPNAPTAPSNLLATAVSSSQIDLIWADNANNEIGFRIERKTGAAGTYAEIDTVAAGVTSYSSTGLSAATPYFYRVRAHNAGGASAYSSEAGATTAPNPPTAPSGLTATTVSHSQINLEWNDDASSENGFIIERKTGAGGTYAVIDSASANDTTYASTGLSGSTGYYYRVRAYNAGGNSPYSNEANATTLPDPPAAPGSLTAAAVSSSRIDLAWSDNSSDEDGFKIWLKTAADSTYAQIATAAANATSYSSTGLNPSTIYFYKVSAYNANGSTFSNVASDTTLPDLPMAPSGLAATPVSHAKINLTWADNSSNETGFKIERKLTSAATFAEIATVGANVTSFASTGLNANTSYTYRVRAHNASGNSAYSNTASATTLVTPPAAPSGLIATAMSSSQIDLAWTDNASNEDGFKLERKAAGDTAFTEIVSLGANVTSYSNSGLAAGTVYFYRLRAHRAGNSFSGYSNVA